MVGVKLGLGQRNTFIEENVFGQPTWLFLAGYGLWFSRGFLLVLGAGKQQSWWKEARRKAEADVLLQL